jgi:hypothetical protein
MFLMIVAGVGIVLLSKKQTEKAKTAGGVKK